MAATSCGAISGTGHLRPARDRRQHMAMSFRSLLTLLAAIILVAALAQLRPIDDGNRARLERLLSPKAVFEEVHRERPLLLYRGLCQ